MFSLVLPPCALRAASGGAPLSLSLPSFPGVSRRTLCFLSSTSLSPSTHTYIRVHIHVCMYMASSRFHPLPISIQTARIPKGGGAVTLRAEYRSRLSRATAVIWRTAAIRDRNERRITSSALSVSSRESHRSFTRAGG